MNKKCLFAVVIVLVSLICLSACGALRDTADKNKALNESLPYYELNAANYDEISYNGLTYTITDECLEMSELQEEIGQVSKRFKNVAGEDFSFGYVYSIVDVDISNAVAVNINNEYRKGGCGQNLGPYGYPANKFDVRIPLDCLYSRGLIPPRESLIRFSQYQCRY